MRSYYNISRQKLGENARLPLFCFDSSEEVFETMARDMKECIIENNKKGKDTVLICPVGPVGQYAPFTEMVNRERIDLRRVWFFNMDEYLDENDRYIDVQSPLSFRGFMEREVYGKINPALVMPEDQRIFPDPEHPEKTDALLEQLGGADITFGGIGINGHLAFNEPQPGMSCEQFARLGTRVLTISPETRAANAIGDLGGALEEMPKRCVTIGMRQILGAKKLRLGVFRDWHRAVCRRAAYGEVSASFPVTLAQRHKDARLYVNDVAAREP